MVEAVFPGRSLPPPVEQQAKTGETGENRAGRFRHNRAGDGNIVKTCPEVGGVVITIADISDREFHGCVVEASQPGEPNAVRGECLGRWTAASRVGSALVQRKLPTGRVGRRWQVVVVVSCIKIERKVC